MKLKIQKAGKTQEFNLINSWSEVNLDKWAKLVSMKTKTNSQEAVETISVLADMPKRLIKELAIKDVSKILEKIAVMQSQAESKLTKIITIDDIEYGFHPQLDDLTLGEYIDLDNFIGDWDNMEKAMNVLYRPILVKVKEKYSIEEYRVGTESELLDMPMDAVMSSVFFLWNLGLELSTVMTNYLDNQDNEALTQYLNSQANGDGTQAFMDSLKVTLQDLKISLN